MKERSSIRDKRFKFRDAKAAQDMGITIIHQELNLAPDLTAAQNIFIGREPRKWMSIFVDESKLNKQAEQIFERMNLPISPTVKVSELTVAKQQMVEIAKALSLRFKCTHYG